jgi:iron complex transport system permease protein
MTATIPGPGPRPALPRPALLGLAVGVLVLACLASLALGARELDTATLVAALTDFDEADGDHAVLASRVPRTVVAVLVGASLGLAGAAMQGVARNPLADPGILGVSAGAALGVVLAISLLGITTLTGYVWFAFLGAGLASVVVYAVASTGRGGATPVALALAGAVLSAGLSSLLNGVLVTSQQTLDAFRFWQVGSVAGRGWDVIVPVLPFLAVGAVVVLGTARVLNGLALGDDVARSLGQSVAVGRAVTALGVVVLCGAATALAGPMLFVGLVVPHAARRLAGPDHRWVLPLSMVIAPALVVLADTAGRLVLPPGEVSAGVMTAVLGAPAFLWLVHRSREVGL